MQRAAAFSVDGRVELRLEEEPSGSGVVVDFSTFQLKGLAHHPLVKAVGRSADTIIDATAGLCWDAWLLAATGRRIIALERSIDMVRVTRDALDRALQDPAIADIASRIELIHADAIEVVSKWRADSGASVVSLDPMYPHCESSALPPRDIRLVRAAVGDDADTDALFAAAMQSGARRVVVRRPHRAPPLSGHVNAQFPSKLVRYDLYLPMDTR
ncbi:MAG: class I SAM-dependent methyltransferase [Planctomycetota bacterium]|nr:class I SAM-dependent methyltransferase [Planctomycetota bacterium]